MNNTQHNLKDEIPILITDISSYVRLWLKKRCSTDPKDADISETFNIDCLPKNSYPFL